MWLRRGIPGSIVYVLSNLSWNSLSLFLLFVGFQFCEQQAQPFLLLFILFFYFFKRYCRLSCLFGGFGSACIILDLTRVSGSKTSCHKHTPNYWIFLYLFHLFERQCALSVREDFVLYGRFIPACVIHFSMVGLHYEHVWGWSRVVILET